MSGTVISAGSSRLSTAPEPSVTGSAAEQELRKAQKAYTKAVEKLMEDATGGASKDVIEMDRVAVDTAAAAVARALVAVAREEQQKSTGAPSTAAGASSSGGSGVPPQQDTVGLSTRPGSGASTSLSVEDRRGGRSDSTADRAADLAGQHNRSRVDELLAVVMSVDVRA